MKKMFLIILSFIIISLMGIGTYALLKNKSTNENNVISTGTFSKFNIRLYSGAVPVCMDSSSDQQITSYPFWLNDASEYIIRDMTGQNLNEPEPRNAFETYINIANGSTGVSRSSGTVIHNLVIIENSVRFGHPSPKIKLSDLKLDDLTISINQYDVFKGLLVEYAVQRPAQTFNAGLDINSTRIRTFDLIDGLFVRSYENGQPALEADLILFDVGGEDYYCDPQNIGQLNEQQVLDQTYERLCGIRPHADFDDINYIIHYPQSSAVYNTVLSMIDKNDLICSLDRSVCVVSLIRDNVSISDIRNTIYYG